LARGTTLALATALVVATGLLLLLGPDDRPAPRDRAETKAGAPEDRAPAAGAVAGGEEVGGEEARGEEADAEAPRDVAPTSSGTARPRLPDGALPPILDEPSGDRLDYCDARQWRDLGGLVAGVHDGVLEVHGPAWRSAGASGRAGVAGWASRCRLAGEPVTVREAGTGRVLGRYDPSGGYVRAD